MVNNQLLEYVKTQLKNGFQKADVIAAVRKAGWQEQMLQDALVEIERPAIRPAPVATISRPLQPQAPIARPTFPVTTPQTIRPVIQQPAASVIAPQVARPTIMPQQNPQTVAPARTPIQNVTVQKPFAQDFGTPQMPQMQKKVFTPNPAFAAAPVRVNPFPEVRPAVTPQASVPAATPPPVATPAAAVPTSAVPFRVVESVAQKPAAPIAPKMPTLIEDGAMPEIIREQQPAAEAPKQPQPTQKAVPLSEAFMPNARPHIEPVIIPMRTAQTPPMMPKFSQSSAPILAPKPAVPASAAAPAVQQFSPLGRSMSTPAAPAFSGMRPLPNQSVPQGIPLPAANPAPRNFNATLPPVGFRGPAAPIPRKKSHHILAFFFILLIILGGGAAFAYYAYPAESKQLFNDTKAKVISYIPGLAPKPEEILAQALARVTSSPRLQYSFATSGKGSQTATSTVYAINFSSSGFADFSNAFPQMRTIVAFSAIPAGTTTAALDAKAEALVLKNQTSYIKINSLAGAFAIAPELKAYLGKWIGLSSTTTAGYTNTVLPAGSASHITEIRNILLQSGIVTVAAALPDETNSAGIATYHYQLAVAKEKILPALEAIAAALGQSPTGEEIARMQAEIAALSVPTIDVWIDKTTFDFRQIKTAVSSATRAGQSVTITGSLAAFAENPAIFAAPQGPIPFEQVMTAVVNSFLAKPKAPAKAPAKK